jgi:hypothetical protein
MRSFQGLSDQFNQSISKSIDREIYLNLIEKFNGERKFSIIYWSVTKEAIPLKLLLAGLR